MGARIETYSEDSVIVKEGTVSEKMYLVLEGSVTLYMNYGKQNEYVFGIAGKNRVFGEMGILAKEKSIYTAVAFSEVKVAWFDELSINVFFEHYPAYALNLMKNMCKSYSLMKKNLILSLEEIDYMKQFMPDTETEINGECDTDAGRLRIDKALNAYKESSLGVSKYLYRNSQYLA